MGKKLLITTITILYEKNGSPYWYSEEKMLKNTFIFINKSFV